MYKTIKNITIPAKSSITIEHGLKEKPLYIVATPFPDDLEKNAIIGLVEATEETITLHNASSEEAPVRLFLDCLHSIGTNKRELENQEPIFINTKSSFGRDNTETIIKYVDPVNGNDNNSGDSWETAWKSLQYALNRFNDFEGCKNYVLVLAEGSFNENITFRKNTTSNIIIIGQEKAVQSNIFHKEAIVNVDTTNLIIYLSGDQTAYYHVGSKVQIEGSDSSDGEYTVSDVTYNSGSDQTEITVIEAIPSSSNWGYLLNVAITPYDFNEADGYGYLICKYDQAVSDEDLKDKFIKLNYVSYGYNYISYLKIVSYTDIDPANNIYKFKFVGLTTGGKKYTYSGNNAYNLNPLDIVSIDIIQPATRIAGDTSIPYQTNIDIDFTSESSNAFFFVNVILGIYTGDTATSSYIIRFAGSVYNIGCCLLDSVYTWLYNTGISNYLYFDVIPPILNQLNYYNDDVDSVYNDGFIHIGNSIRFRGRQCLETTAIIDLSSNQRSCELEAAHTKTYMLYLKNSALQVWASKLAIRGRCYIGGNIVLDRERPGSGYPSGIYISHNYYYDIIKKTVIGLNNAARENVAIYIGEGSIFVNTNEDRNTTITLSNSYLDLDSVIVLKKTAQLLADTINIDKLDGSVTSSAIIVEPLSKLVVHNDLIAQVNPLATDKYLFETTNASIDIGYLNATIGSINNAGVIKADKTEIRTDRVYITINNSYDNWNLPVIALTDSNWVCVNNYTANLSNISVTGNLDLFDLSHSRLICHNRLLISGGSTTTGAITGRYFLLHSNSYLYASELNIAESSATEIGETNSCLEIQQASKIITPRFNASIYRGSTSNVLYKIIDQSEFAIGRIEFNRFVANTGSAQDRSLFYLSNGAKLTIEEGYIKDYYDNHNNNAIIRAINNSELYLNKMYYGYDTKSGIYSDSGNYTLDLNSSKLIIGDSPVAFEGTTSRTVNAANTPLFRFVNSEVIINSSLDFLSGDYGDVDGLITITDNSKVIVNQAPTTADASSYNLRDATNTAYSYKHCINLFYKSSLIIFTANGDEYTAFWSSQADTTPTYQIFNFGKLGVVSWGYPDGVRNDIDVVPGTAGDPGDHHLVLVKCSFPVS